MDTLVDFNKLWNYSDPVATEQKFRELLPAANESDDDSYRLQLLTQIARTLGLQRKFEEAHQLLDDIEKELNDSLSVARIRYHLERGRAFNSSGKKEEARKQFDMAFDLSQKTDEPYYAVDAAHMIAIVETPEKALDWNIKAVAIAEESKDERAIKWLGSLYNNIGWTYHSMKEYQKSLDYFIQAKDWHEAYGRQRTIDIAWWCIAKGKRYLDRIDEALQILQKLRSAGKEDGYTFEELGECYLIKGQNDLAKENFAKAYELLSKDEWLIANEQERLNRLKELSGR